MAISSARFSPKTDNNPKAFRAKVEIRKAVLEAMGGRAAVFDGFAYKSNVMPTAIRVLTGLKPGVVGLSRKQDSVIDRAIVGLAKRMRCDVVKRLQADGRTGASMRYIGLVLKGR